MGSEFFTFLFLKLWLLIFFYILDSLLSFHERPLSNFFYVFWILYFVFSLRLFVNFSYLFKACHFSFSDGFFLFFLNFFNVVSLHRINVFSFFLYSASPLFFFMYSFLHALRSFSSISLFSIKV